MSWLVTFVLVLAPASLVAALAPTPAGGARLGARLAAVGAIGAVAVAGWTTDAFGVLVLALVLGLGATVLSYAARALRDEPYQRRFAVVAPLLVLVTATTVVAEHLAVVAAAWVATSVLAVLLVRTGPGTSAEHSVRMARAFIVGDLALVTAVVMTLADIGSPTVAATLAVTAAAARCASGPFLRWLPDTLAAPTPTSALLHAGVVGGGAVVLIRHGEALAPTPGAALAMAVSALVVGGLTCVLAEAVMVTRPDVKGQLAWSTIAQLSFTLVLVGLDLHVAAGLHLVAHGAYKGALFLGSGSTVRSLVRRRQAGTGRREDVPIRVAIGAACAAVVVAVVHTSGTPWTTELALPLLLAWVTALCLAGAAARRAVDLRERIAVVGGAAAAVATYAAATLGLKAAVGPAIEVAAPTLPGFLLVPVLLGLVSVAATRHRARPGLWAAIAAAGTPTPPPPLRRTGWRPQRAPRPLLQPAPTSIGA